MLKPTTTEYTESKQFHLFTLIYSSSQQ